jgi:cytochrome c553
MSGAQLYDAYCATCHQDQGQGGRGIPRLFQTTALGTTHTNNLVAVILQGVHRQNDVPMPGFANELSDQQIVTLGGYLIQHFGNPNATVTVNQVKTLRGGGSLSPLIIEVRAALLAGAVVVLAAILLLVTRRRSDGEPDGTADDASARQQGASRRWSPPPIR